MLERKEKLLSFFIIIAADAMIAGGGVFIGRLPDNAGPVYLCIGGTTGKPGGPKKHDGKINAKKNNKMVFKQVQTDDGTAPHAAAVHSVSLECIMVICIQIGDKKGKTPCKVYFSTGTQMDAALNLNYYKSRFQIEFLYREAKQRKELNDCQDISEKKMHFQFNADLAAINIFNVTRWIIIPTQQRKAFPMAAIKKNELHSVTNRAVFYQVWHQPERI